jgi:hypothetical protein
MKIPELFATFGYRHQLVDLWGKQAQKSTRLRKWVDDQLRKAKIFGR